jgi:transcriptional regulator with PAS, ATPase and Fis domain
VATIQRNTDYLMNVILDSIADGVFTIDKYKKIMSFNKAAEKITSISREHAIGQKCFDVFHANICETSCYLEKTLKTGKEFFVVNCGVLPDTLLESELFGYKMGAFTDAKKDKLSAKRIKKRLSKFSKSILFLRLHYPFF